MDTIAAPATAAGGGVGIIRVSGPKAAAIAKTVMRPWPAQPESHKLYYGHIFRGEQPIDDALGVLMIAPHSYTGEDVFELHGHGGEIVLHQLLEATLDAGARMAEPGEFTRRAFENGRMSLDQAEAVATIIGARSERALKAAQALRNGVLGEQLAALKANVIPVLAELEGVLDFPDEQLTGATSASLVATLRATAAALSRVTEQRARWLESIPTIVLYGSVNAGKSSLFNCLLGESRAIVDPEPGTTRDTVEAEIALFGIKARLIDTAGERDLPGRIEAKGLELGRRARETASVAVLVIDASTGFADDQRGLLALGKSNNLIVAWNKADLTTSLPPSWDGVSIQTSALREQGIDALRRAMADALGITDGENSEVVVMERHRTALKVAEQKCREAAELLVMKQPAELSAVVLREGLREIERVTGANIDSAVLDQIFARFCIGK